MVEGPSHGENAFVIIFMYDLFWCGPWFVLWLALQSAHWRKPRATISSRPTATPPKAACTPTARGAPCPPSTGALTPAPNQSQRSRPLGRSCAWSPARQAPSPQPPPPSSNTGSTALPTQTLVHQPPSPPPTPPTCPCSRQLKPVQEVRYSGGGVGGCERVERCYDMLLPVSALLPVTSLHFSPLLRQQ